MTTAHATAEPVITESATNESLKELDALFDEIDKLEKNRNHANPFPRNINPKNNLDNPVRPADGCVSGDLPDRLRFLPRHHLGDVQDVVFYASVAYEHVREGRAQQRVYRVFRQAGQVSAAQVAEFVGDGVALRGGFGDDGFVVHAERVVDQVEVVGDGVVERKQFVAHYLRHLHAGGVFYAHVQFG